MQTSAKQVKEDQNAQLNHPVLSQLSGAEARARMGDLTPNNAWRPLLAGWNRRINASLHHCSMNAGQSPPLGHHCSVWSSHARHVSDAIGEAAIFNRFQPVSSNTTELLSGNESGLIQICVSNSHLSKQTTRPRHHPVTTQQRTGHTSL